MVEDEPVAESSKRAETYVDVAPSLKDIGKKDKSQAEKVRGLVICLGDSSC